MEVQHVGEDGVAPDDSIGAAVDNELDTDISGIWANFPWIQRGNNMGGRSKCNRVMGVDRDGLPEGQVESSSRGCVIDENETAGTVLLD